MIKDKKLIYLATPYSSDDKKVLLKRVKNVTEEVADLDIGAAATYTINPVQ